MYINTSLILSPQVIAFCQFLQETDKINNQINHVNPVKKKIIVRVEPAAATCQAIVLTTAEASCEAWSVAKNKMERS
ncbi:MAG: hypothetical protein K8R79_12110 [Calditrichales bacterium]|nr:hypothetical protein [Calditrichales bacterium]